MKLSIIIPVYKVEAWLEKTLESVLCQTLKNFELILVDDGSPDNCGRICDAYAEKDSRVRVIHKENGGVSSARNAGLDAARGEYIGWVDADDLIEADMYERLIALAESTGAAIAQCQHDRETVCNNRPRSAEAIQMTGVEFVERMFQCQGWRYTNQVSLWSKVFRRELWGYIRFPDGQVYEDEMQTYKVCLKAEKIVETQDVLYHYVKREDSIITGDNPEKLLDKQVSLLDKLDYLPKQLPHLEEVCAKKFFSWSTHILCRMYADGAWEELKIATDVLLGQKERLMPWLNKYDKVYLHLLRWKWARNWIAGNDFAPIQNWLAGVKQSLRGR